MHIFLNILKMQMNICLRDLPTRKKSRLPSRAPTHAYADCEISGQQPTQLYKEFPRVHEAGHSKKNAAHLGFVGFRISKNICTWPEYHGEFRPREYLEVPGPPGSG